MIFDPLTFFGLCAVTAMLVFYALEDHSHWLILAFAGACVLGSIYGFLQGAWPFGIVEAIWAVVAVRRWQRTQIRTLPSSLGQRFCQPHAMTIYFSLAPTHILGPCAAVPPTS
jgi:hypothetical protein